MALSLTDHARLHMATAAILSDQYIRGWVSDLRDVPAGRRDFLVSGVCAVGVA